MGMAIHTGPNRLHIIRPHHQRTILHGCRPKNHDNDLLGHNHNFDGGSKVKSEKVAQQQQVHIKCNNFRGFNACEPQKIALPRNFAKFITIDLRRNFVDSILRATKTVTKKFRNIHHNAPKEERQLQQLRGFRPASYNNALPRNFAKFITIDLRRNFVDSILRATKTVTKKFRNIHHNAPKEERQLQQLRGFRPASFNNVSRSILFFLREIKTSSYMIRGITKKFAKFITIDLRRNLADSILRITKTVTKKFRNIHHNAPKEERQLQQLRGFRPASFNNVTTHLRRNVSYNNFVDFVLQASTILRFFDLKKLSYFFFVGVAFTNCDWPEDFPASIHEKCPLHRENHPVQTNTLATPTP
ncbi:hypothetical protein QE152_g353 [Popillia japonica]|uniref:Uncharacterized protein n=1 Tax=Popillia japonica TaxID=7064 RepID=A0AAW1NK79_POPJA